MDKSKVGKKMKGSEYRKLENKESNGPPEG